MKVNLPNQITLLRLALAVVFFVVLGQYSEHAPAPNRRLLDIGLVMFVVAAATDYLDGYLARKQNQVTALGRILDPFVDKVLVCGAFIFLAGPDFCDSEARNVTGLKPWMIVVILGRELLVTGLRGFSESRGIAYGAGYVGKAKMWIQSITVVVLLATIAHPTAVSAAATTWTRIGFVWLTVAVTAASLVGYLVQSRAVLLESSR